MRPIILGIDPGTTSAYAAIDFDFNLIGVESKKDFSISEMISKAILHGEPIIIGTDKKEIPSFIKEFSQKVGAKIAAPSYDTKKGEKKRLVTTSKFIKYVKNAHEIDAIASAIYAYHSYLELIKKIKATLERENKQGLQSRVISLVILENISINNAISTLEEKGNEAIAEAKRKKIRQLTPQKELTKEEKEILFLRMHNLRLRQALDKKQEELDRECSKEIDIDSFSKKRLSFKERKILALEEALKKFSSELFKIQKKNERLGYYLVQSERYIVAKKLRNLGKEEIESNRKKINEQDVLFVEDISVISNDAIIFLKKEKISVILFAKKKSSIAEKEFILIDISNLEHELIDSFVFIKKSDLIGALNKEQKKEKSPDILKGIVFDYKKERQNAIR
ncbi:MAG: DUF460 domain-containing protein [archaeon]